MSKSIQPYIMPVAGAAKYISGYTDPPDYKPCVWMINVNGDWSIIDTAKTIESAHKKANTLQRKENKSVLKSKK